MGRPPLRQIAELAGVSEPTVSRVLNGRPGVAQATRDRVVDALAELGHETTAPMAPPPRNVVGVVLGEFSNPIFPAIADSIAESLDRRGVVVTIAVPGSGANSEERCATELLRSDVDGLILVGGAHHRVDGDMTIYAELAEAGFPMVFVNGAATGLPVAHVRCDETIGATKAVHHLVALGHTHIGYILGSAEFAATQHFIKGFEIGLLERSIVPQEPAGIEVPFTFEGGRAGATELLERGCTAAICGNDLMALGALRAARAAGQPFSVIGYDGTDMTAFTDPPLTTLRQPVDDMAEAIAGALINSISRNATFRGEYVFEPQLIVRDSTSGAPRPASAG